MSKRNMMIAAAIVLVLFGFWALRPKKDKTRITKEISPVYGRIENSVSSTGTIQPQNRLEIKPPIGGRIEKILVEEGQHVKIGDTLAIMSSTERAALLDAARLQSMDTLKQWEDVYRPTPLLAPIDGDVIVKSVNPGQTVTPSDPVIVLSDRLIVQAQVDETDIGKIKLGQTAAITLDAYPKIHVNGKVDHIYYESKVVSNVTIYQVDVVPEHVPDVFRSGMSANVRIIQEQKENALLLPLEVIKKEDGDSYVLLAQEGGRKPLKQEVELGISGDSDVEVVSGVTANDKVILEIKKYNSPNGRSSASPFMPSGGGGGGGRRGGSR